MGLDKYKSGFKLAIHEDALEIPYTWKSSKIVFVNSMSDLFHENIPLSFIKRVFKVMKTPLSNAEQPPRLRDLIGYDMYQLDTETGLMKEYADFFSEEAERQYWMKMVDLAYDIHEALIYLKEGETNAEVKNILKRKTIYLAETGHDLSVQRNIIKRELQRHGYIVLPKQTLPIQRRDRALVGQAARNAKHRRHRDLASQRDRFVTRYQ